MGTAVVQGRCPDDRWKRAGAEAQLVRHLRRDSRRARAESWLSEQGATSGVAPDQPQSMHRPQPAVVRCWSGSVSAEPRNTGRGARTPAHLECGSRPVSCRPPVEAANVARASPAPKRRRSTRLNDSMLNTAWLLAVRGVARGLAPTSGHPHGSTVGSAARCQRLRGLQRDPGLS